MGMAFFSPFNTCTYSCSCSMVSFCIIDGALVCSSHMPEMATQVDESTVKLNPRVVGNAFAEQYYNTLSKSPELLHNFYNDSSLIGRPGLDGSVSSVSTLEVRATFQKSLEELFLLGALTDDCKLSEPVGHQMARLPLDPVYSKDLILAS